MDYGSAPRIPSMCAFDVALPEGPKEEETYIVTVDGREASRMAAVRDADGVWALAVPAVVDLRSGSQPRPAPSTETSPGVSQ